MDEDTAEYLKLPVDERCVNKLWKARVSGYEEAVKLFSRWDGDDANWKKYSGNIKKFITDSNAVAQEKGLEAALAYVENCDAAGRLAGDCVEGIVSKCVAAPKTKTKDLARQIVLMYCEVEQCEKVVEELTKGLSHKNPKVVAGCVSNMTECLRAFGGKVIKISPLLKAIVPLLDHRDKTVREEGKQLIVQSHRWVGDIMKQQLQGLKPVQMSELETEFANNTEKAKPERLLRSQQALGGSADAGDGPGAAAAGVGEEDEDEQGGEEDLFDLLDPVEILDKLPKNFFELVEEKKWQLRKEALDALLPLSQSAKISSAGDYGDLLRVLKKFIGKDINVMLVTQAAQCLAGMARGLRGNMKSGAAQCLPTVLEKLKEKKATCVAALRDCADALYPCLGVDAIQEDCLASLKHKTPAVQSETAKFLARCFAKCPPQLVSNKKMVKGYVGSLLDCLSHSDPNVRDSASEALGVLMKILGELLMNKLMPDLDNLKLAKVKEFADKAVLTGKMPKAQPPPEAAERPKVVRPRGGGGAAKKSTVTRPPRGGGKTSVVKIEQEPPEEDEEPREVVRKVSSAPARRGGGGGGSSRGRANGTSRPATASYGSRKKSEDVDSGPPYTNTGNLKNQRFKEEQKLKLLRWQFTTPRGEFVDQLKDQMTTANWNKTLMAQMFHSDFKQHLKAIETLSKHMEADVECLSANLDLILKWTTLRFFETNPSVLLKSLEYLNDVFSLLADDSYGLHDIEAVSFIPYLVNRVGDPKDQVRNSVKAIFRSLRQIYPVSKLCPYILEGLKAKNAKQRAECLEDIGGMIRDYGINVLQPSPPQSMKEMAKQIADRDNSVRNAALNTITEAYFQTGERMYKMLGHLPERDMAMLEERIKRTSKTRPAPAPVHASASQPVLSSMDPSSSSALPRPSSNKNNIHPSASTSALRRYQHQQQQQQQQQQQPDQAMLQQQFQQQQLQRKSPRHGRERPVSGAFTLDLEKIESGSMDGSMGGPQLVNHNLDAIFNDDPVTLPPTLARRGIPMSPPQQQQMPLTESAEAYEALDVVIAQVFNKESSSAISALSQLDELLKDGDKVQLLHSRIDQLLTACYMQYRHVLANKMRTDNANAKEVTRLFQFVTMVLMSLYHHTDVTKGASSSALHDLLHVVISILLEPRVEQLTDGAQLVRALNVLTVKIIDRSDHTAVSSAFVKLLGDAVANSSMNPKFVDIVMKCMWKMIRQLPAWADDKLDIDLLLADLHQFLKTYPPAYWKKQDSDTPMRTVKTVLHTLVKVNGDAILDHITRIEDPQGSELVAYLKKLLNSGIGKENTENKVTTSQQQRFSKSDHEALGDIFEKIGQKELTKQGLQELYNFKQQNPHADLEPFLAKSSEYFRNYIERGLKGIETDMSSATKQNVLADATTRRSVADNNGSSANEAAPHMLYLDRLKKLRAQGGLDQVSSGYATSTSGSAAASVTSAYRIAATSSKASTETYQYRSSVEQNDDDDDDSGPASNNDARSPPNVEDIRKRLERIKQSAF